MTKKSAKDLIPYQSRLEEIAEQIKEYWKEGYSQSRLVLVEMYHQIGEAIHSLPNKPETLADLRKMTSISESTLYRATQFYKKYPDYISQLPEGKQITWNKIITKYLPSSKKEKESCQHEWIEVCRFCGEKRSNN